MIQASESLHRRLWAEWLGPIVREELIYLGKYWLEIHYKKIPPWGALHIETVSVVIWDLLHVLVWRSQFQLHLCVYQWGELFVYCCAVARSIVGHCEKGILPYSTWSKPAPWCALLGKGGLLLWIPRFLGAIHSNLWAEGLSSLQKMFALGSWKVLVANAMKRLWVTGRGSSWFLRWEKELFFGG